MRQWLLRLFVRRRVLPAQDARTMMQWQHGGGFSVDASVCIAAADRAGRERLLRCHPAKPGVSPGRLVSQAEHEPPDMGKVFCMGATDILAEILRLSANERARLALELIRSLDGEPEAGAAQAWDVEIKRRSAEIDRDAADTMTLAEYRAHVRQRRAARANR